MQECTTVRELYTWVLQRQNGFNGSPCGLYA